MALSDMSDAEIAALEPDRLENLVHNTIVTTLHQQGWIANGVVNGRQFMLHRTTGREIKIDVTRTIRDSEGWVLDEMDPLPEDIAILRETFGTDPHPFEERFDTGVLYCAKCNLPRENARHRPVPIDEQEPKPVDITSAEALRAHLLKDHGWDSNPTGIITDPEGTLRAMHQDDHDDQAYEHEHALTPPALSSISNADMLREISKLCDMVVSRTLTWEQFFGAVEVTLGRRQKNKRLEHLIQQVADGDVPTSVLIAYVDTLVDP